MGEQPAVAEQIEADDAKLAEVMAGALRTMDRLGLTAQDFLDELPAARAEVLEQAYGRAFLHELERRFADAHRPR